MLDSLMGCDLGNKHVAYSYQKLVIVFTQCSFSTSYCFFFIMLCHITTIFYFTHIIRISSIINQFEKNRFFDNMYYATDILKIYNA
jgi:hypothetical protein